MPSTFDKLNLKNQRQILVLQAPETFEPEMASLRGVTVHRNPADLGEIEFALAFVTTQRTLDVVAKTIAKNAKGDAVIWFAYPKGTSKNYQSEITRDGSWQVLGAQGFEPVRMIAIDEDWSAVRFRRVEFIKTMTRAKGHRLTERAKKR